MNIIVTDERRGMRMLIPYSVAAETDDWQGMAIRELRHFLIVDGCVPETIEVDEPFHAAHDMGIPLGAWEIRAEGYRPSDGGHEHTVD